jgi:hypothetical protein
LEKIIQFANIGHHLRCPAISLVQQRIRAVVTPSCPSIPGQQGAHSDSGQGDHGEMINGHDNGSGGMDIPGDGMIGKRRTGNRNRVGGRQLFVMT